ncbi:site-specific DNA-methyltransferase [uncultured Prevotella sp.]|uniref:site-specific DNA-methyltransferase n=1 Tax=uncultured Prevotella sp. TaxID=159272 RepID=UPI0025892D62|nr:site-specific DNA-methyltransferase [uncultured Prevotella sp.]
MKEFKPTKLDKETTDGTVRNLDALYQLFPSCFTEAKDAISGDIRRVVDWSKLRSLLGEYVENDEPEKYDFTWVGKRAAQREAAAPCRKTLRPCKEESVDWDTTQNLYIEGDNLEVLKLLQNSYMGKVKMIYIDPPYNTGNDFVYHDDFDKDYSEYDEHNKFEDGVRFWKNTDSNGRFHSDWCSMIYARLMVARSLLTEDGVIFISIDKNEILNIVKIGDEVFGSSNRIGIISTINNLKGRSDDAFFATCNEFLVVFAKSSHVLKLKGFALDEEEMDNDYEKQDEIGYYKLIGYRKTGNAWKREDRPYMFYPVLFKDNNFTTVNKEELSKIFNVKTQQFDDEYVSYLTSHYSALGYQVVWPKSETGELGRWRWGVQSFYEQKDYNLEFNRAGTLCTKMRATLEDGSIRVKTAKTMWYKPEYDTGSSARILKALFGKSDIFDNPKSLVYMTDIIKISTNEDSLILDFFSGSATLAHAIMLQNELDNGHRKFIMVQLPEETAEDSEAYKAGYKNICEIGKERIRRAGKKIKEEHPEAKDLDTGFRVLRCDESNYKPVAFAPKDYTQESLDMFLDNIKDERTGLDLLFDCMMRWGLELSLPYDTQKVDGCTIYNVDEGSLVACFDGVVTSAVIDAIAETHPLRVVFRDSSFTEAAQKMNLFELFKQKCGWTDQEVQNNVRVI